MLNAYCDPLVLASANYFGAATVLNTDTSSTQVLLGFNTQQRSAEQWSQSA